MPTGARNMPIGLLFALPCFAAAATTPSSPPPPSPTPFPYMIDQAAHDVSASDVNGFSVSRLRSYGVRQAAAYSVDCATTLDAIPGGPWYSAAGLAKVNSTRAQVSEMIGVAHAAGLKAYLSSDLFQFPDRLLARYGGEMVNKSAHCGGYTRFAGGCVELTQNFTRYAYGVLFDELAGLFPGMDGIVTRYGENSPCDEHSGNTPVDSTTDGTLIASLQSLLLFLREELCVKRNLTVVFRTWDTSTQYLHANATFYEAVVSAVPPHPLLVFSVKHTMLDFWRRVRFNPTLGVGLHQQVVEAEVGGMYGGCGTWPLYIGDGLINFYEEDMEPGTGGEPRGLTWLRNGGGGDAGELFLEGAGESLGKESVGAHTDTGAAADGSAGGAHTSDDDDDDQKAQQMGGEGPPSRRRRRRRQQQQQRPTAPLAGVLTNHQCTSTPEVKDPWLWPRIEQAVIAGWAREPWRAESDIFDGVVGEQLGLAASPQARAAFRNLTLISMSANLRMQTVDAFDKTLQEVDRPTANWLLWDGVGGIRTLANTTGACHTYAAHGCEVFQWLLAHDGEVQASIDEKFLAAALHAQANSTAYAEVAPYMPNSTLRAALLVSTEAGALVSRMIAGGWAAMLLGWAGDQPGGPPHNASLICGFIEMYDRSYASYAGLGAEGRFGALAPGLVNTSYWEHPNSGVEGMNQSVALYRGLCGGSGHAGGAAVGLPASTSTSFSSSSSSSSSPSSSLSPPLPARLAPSPCASTDAQITHATEVFCASIFGCSGGGGGGGGSSWCPCPANMTASGDWPSQATYFEAVVEALLDAAAASPGGSEGVSGAGRPDGTTADITVHTTSDNAAAPPSSPQSSLSSSSSSSSSSSCLTTPTAVQAVAGFLEEYSSNATVEGSLMNTWVVFQAQYYDMPRLPGERIESPGTLGEKCWAFASLAQQLNASALAQALGAAGLAAPNFLAAYGSAVPLTLNLCNEVLANCFANATYDPVARNGTCPGSVAQFAVGFEYENAQRGFAVTYPFFGGA